jgi:hypothetical protein
MLRPAGVVGVWTCRRIRIVVVLAVGQNGWVGTGEVWG